MACAARKVGRGWSGGVSVFVDEAVVSAGSEHGDGRRRSFGRIMGWCWRSLVEGLVWPVLVVVLDVVDDESLELAAVPDDGAVEKLSADRSDPALGEAVGDRGPDGCAEGLQALRPEDLVKGSVALIDQGARFIEPASVVGQITSASSPKAAARRRCRCRASTPSS